MPFAHGIDVILLLCDGNRIVLKKPRNDKSRLRESRNFAKKAWHEWLGSCRAVSNCRPNPDFILGSNKKVLLMITFTTKKAGAIMALIAGVAIAASIPAFSQGFRFRFDGDERGNVEGKRASCEVYAQVAVVQAEANRKLRCGYAGGRWDTNPEPHFRWCRFVRRETIALEARDRAVELQRCFDRMGDFDDDRWDRRR
jgi:hypothetical protein